MSDYNMYDFTIKETDLIATLHKAAECGCKPLVIINGMYYNIELKESDSK